MPRRRVDPMRAFDELFGARTGDREITGALVVPLERVVPRADQPRRHFDPARLAELADDIRATREAGGGIEGTGIIQPLLVTQAEGGGYSLTAGERRWRAAQLAGGTEVPVIVREQSPDNAYEDALRENIQRQDLTPLEEAAALQQIMTARAWSVRQAAERFGKDKGWVENRLRVLRAGEDIRAMVSVRTDTMQHARLIDPITDPALRAALIAAVLDDGASEREIRRRIAEYEARLAEQAKQEEGEARPPDSETQTAHQPLTDEPTALPAQRAPAASKPRDPLDECILPALHLLGQARLILAVRGYPASAAFQGAVEDLEGHVRELKRIAGME